MRTPEDIAWSAGLFEGEGSISLTQKRYARVQIGMTDPEPLEMMQRIWGGNFNGPYDRVHQLGKKPMYYYCLQGLDSVTEFFEAVRRYLSSRRVEEGCHVLAAARKWAERPPRPISPNCGRRSASDGYRWHQRRKEPTCAECREKARVESIKKNARARERRAGAGG